MTSGIWYQKAKERQSDTKITDNANDGFAHFHLNNPAMGLMSPMEQKGPILFSGR